MRFPARYRQTTGQGRWLCVFAGLLLCTSSTIQAQSEQETRDKLDQLGKSITKLQQDLGKDRAQQGKLQVQLRETETSLGKISREISGIQVKLRENQAQLDNLQAQQLAQEKARELQESRLGEEVLRAYQLGKDSQLKLLLNQQRADSVARAMAYYQYFYRARGQQLEQYQQTLDRLATLRSDIQNTTQTLNASNDRLAQQQQQLLARKQQRQETLDELRQVIASKDQQLKQMEDDRRELEQVMALIEEAAVVVSVPDNYKPFAQLRGALPWPIEGRHANRFGRPRNEGKMRWQGVTIRAEEGTTVEAIHHGRVVYADWLRGYGLLLIIDHGDGYMSLYAHNQTLLREVGEWVAAGSEISTVGDTGGREQTALYFEIRHQGKPVNPGTWCSG